MGGGSYALEIQMGGGSKKFINPGGRGWSQKMLQSMGVCGIFLE